MYSVNELLDVEERDGARGRERALHICQDGCQLRSYLPSALGK